MEKENVVLIFIKEYNADFSTKWNSQHVIKLNSKMSALVLFLIQTKKSFVIASRQFT